MKGTEKRVDERLGVSDFLVCRKAREREGEGLYTLFFPLVLARLVRFVIVWSDPVLHSNSSPSHASLEEG